MTPKLAGARFGWLGHAYERETSPALLPPLTRRALWPRRVAAFVCGKAAGGHFAEASACRHGLGRAINGWMIDFANLRRELPCRQGTRGQVRIG